MCLLNFNFHVVSSSISLPLHPRNPETLHLVVGSEAAREDVQHEEKVYLSMRELVAVLRIATQHFVIVEGTAVLRGMNPLDPAMPIDTVAKKHKHVGLSVDTQWRWEGRLAVVHYNIGVCVHEWTTEQHCDPRHCPSFLPTLSGRLETVAVEKDVSWL